MTTEFKSRPVEWKANAETGVVEAIVSVFGNVDHGGDRVMKGAFDASLKSWEESGDPIPFIWSHDWANPDAHIGVITDAKETDEGLYVKAQIDTDRPFASQVLHLLKSRRVKEFSFGYAVNDSSMGEFEGKTVRELKSVDLFEAGPCLLGMNDSTRLISAASQTSITNEAPTDVLVAARDALDAAIKSRDLSKEVEEESKNTEPEVGSRDNTPTIDTERLIGLLARTRHTEDRN